MYPHRSPQPHAPQVPRKASGPRAAVDRITIGLLSLARSCGLVRSIRELTKAVIAYTFPKRTSLTMFAYWTAPDGVGYTAGKWTRPKIMGVSTSLTPPVATAHTQIQMLSWRPSVLLLLEFFQHTAVNITPDK